MLRILLGFGLAGLIVAIGGSIPVQAGSTRGPGAAYHTVKACDTDCFTCTFRGGQRAMVRVIGDGDTDLDLYVYDEDGILVAYDDDETDRCLATWTPLWTGKFTIKVVNRGGVWNRYRISTN